MPSILQNINNFFVDNEVSRFIFNIKALDRGNKGKPLSTLFSVNYLNDKDISVKLYFELYKLYTASTIIKFLPTADDYMRYQALWNKRVNSSLCFGIKRINNINTRYFHVKIDPIYNKKLINFNPKFLKIPFDIFTEEVGISYEYGKTVLEKKYFYIKSRENIIKFFKAYNINPAFMTTIDHIEYTEFNNESKYIIVKKYDASCDVIMNELNKLNNSFMVEHVKEIDKIYNMKPCFFGNYNDTNIISIYFSLTKSGLPKIEI